MSLLMNALKKAETAKAAGEADAAQPGAPISAGAPKRDLTEELGLDPHPGAAARARGTKSEPLLPPQTVVAPTRGLALELEPETGATLAGETPAIESDNVPSASASARARTAADSTRSVIRAMRSPATFATAAGEYRAKISARARSPLSAASARQP